MRALREMVARNNVDRWVGKVLQTLTTLSPGGQSRAPKESAPTLFTPFAVTVSSLLVSRVTK
jgi:hypothetical protein